MTETAGDEEIIGRYWIDDRLSEYQNFLSPDWWPLFAESTEACPQIREAGNDLMVQWRVATRVADFPATMMEIFSKFAEADFERQPTAYMLPMLADAWEKAIATHAPGFAGGTLFNKAMREARQATQHKVDDAIRRALEDMTPDKIWQNYIRLREFRFRVWGTMQVCAAAVYNAYDGFLRRCAPTIDRDDRLPKRLKARFGQGMYESLFQRPDIQVARELRHAISHNRSRLTDDLRSNPHARGLTVHDDLISVYPGDIRRFLAAMGDAVVNLARSLDGTV